MYVGQTAAGTLNLNADVDTTGTCTVNGGAWNDRFVFGDGVSVDGTIDGAAGLDTLDYSAYTSAVNVNLVNGTATGTSGIQNIENVIGGSGDDVLTSRFMANAQNHDGGLGNNTFHFDAGGTVQGSSLSPIRATGHGDVSYVRFNIDMSNFILPDVGNFESVHHVLENVLFVLEHGNETSQNQNTNAIWRSESAEALDRFKRWPQMDFQNWPEGWHIFYNHQRMLNLLTPLTSASTLTESESPEN